MLHQVKSPLKKLVLALAALLVLSAPGAYADPLPGGTLDPTAVPKFVEPLFVPPAMPRATKVPAKMSKSTAYYEIALRQFKQQILPPGLPATTVWGYGAVGDPSSFSAPSYTIEAKYGAPARVKWINDLKDANGNFLPHLLPVDPTLHWANPGGGLEGRDMHTMMWDGTPGPYTGPVPMVVHLHGALAAQESDGYPEAWVLPNASNIPAGYAKTGTYYDIFKPQAESALQQAWEPGASVYQYDNVQDATTLWYHDHTLGMTRVNVYAGPAGFYVLRGGPRDAVVGTLPGPAPALGDLPGTKYYEIPIVIQDRMFNADGSLFYPDSREFFDGFAGPYVGESSSDIPPTWNPEVFGNTMVVNGKTWPFLDVEARRYRFRFLNGSGSRFLILKAADAQGNSALPFWQIGGDGGFLPAPQRLAELLLGPAERADVIVDFTNVPVGTTITLTNLGPDEPYGGGVPGVDFAASDPGTTGQVMQFRVTKRVSVDKSTPPAKLVLPAAAPLGTATVTRKISLNELESASVCVNELNVAVTCGQPTGYNSDGSPIYPVMAAPLQARLGTVDAAGAGVPLGWMEDPTETPKVGATEIWEIHNFTEDAHPVHIHETQFEVVERVPTIGPARPAEVWETGPKDTVIAYPGEVTRVKAKFSRAGRFVWHCHILEHEDNEMMRPFDVVP